MAGKVGCVARLTLFCFLWAALVFSTRQVRQELRVVRAEKGDAEKRLHVLDELNGRDIGQLPPRAALALALALAKSASFVRENPARDQQLLKSERLLAVALHARPRWGEAETVAAYLSMLRYGSNDRRTIDAFERSLKYAPYLKNAASWRIRFGAQQWNMLSLQARSSVLSEARWVSQNARSDAKLVEHLLGTREAARAFHRDGQGPAPAPAAPHL